MKLHYQTATATFIQLAVVTLLTVIGGIKDVIKNCDTGVECVANSFLWIVILLFMASWYSALFAIGYFAQEKRSHKLARLLIAGQLLTAFFALMLLRTPASLYSGIATAVALVLALWVALLGFRLYKARGKRIVARARKNTGRRRKV